MRDLHPDEHATCYIVRGRGLVVISSCGHTGIINTVAGSDPTRYAEDDGPAAAAILNEPLATAIDAAGNLFIADSVNNRVRRVDSATGTITAFAGTGEATYSGDGNRATAAALVRPALAAPTRVRVERPAPASPIRRE